MDSYTDQHHLSDEGTGQTLNTSVFVISCVIGIATYGFYKLVKYLKEYKVFLDQFKGVPCEDYHWLFGHLLIHPGPTQKGMDWMIELTKKYPRYYLIYIGRTKPVIVLTHPDTAKRVLKTAMPKQAPYNFFHPWLGLGLLTSKGQQWARNRRLLTPGFHFDILKPYMDVYNDATKILLEKWENQAQDGQSVDIHQPVSLCTLDVMLRCAFSYYDDIQGQGEKHPYVESVVSLGKLIIGRYFNPLVYNQFLYRLTSNGRKYYNKCAFVHDFANEIISNRKKQLSQKANDIPNKKYVDFLDILLLARDEDGTGLTDLEIRQEVDTFLFEGHDTTASAICWFLYSMAKHPEYQNKCKEEIDELFFDRESENVEFDDLNKIPFLQQCIKEALRLHSPVPFIGRVLTEPMEIEGKVFSEGVAVDTPVFLIHHNETVWGKDHMEYKPERFSPENITKIGPYDFIPFSAGPRNCIGQHFAMHEIKTIAIRVLRHFNLNLDDSVPVSYYSGLVMRSENGMNIHMSRRNVKE